MGAQLSQMQQSGASGVILSLFPRPFVPSEVEGQWPSEAGAGNDAGSRLRSHDPSTTLETNGVGKIQEGSSIHKLWNNWVLQPA
jgi:hypothetical protein